MGPGHFDIFLCQNAPALLTEKFFIYSVLKAITGSFLDAAFAGINPPINVSITLNITSAIALLK